MKHKMLYVLIVLILAFVLVSCDAMLDYRNVFGSPVKTTVAELEKATLADIADLAASPSFFASLSADPDLKAAVISNLRGKATDPAATTAERAEASQLAAEILIYSSPAGELVGNIGSALLSNQSMLSSPDSVDPAVLLGAILPDSVYKADGSIDPVAFASMIDALDESYDYFLIFNNNLEGNESNYTDAQLGDMGMTALMAAVIYSITPPAGEDKSDYLLAFITAPESVAAPELNFEAVSSLDALVAASGLSGLIPSSGN